MGALAGHIAIVTGSTRGIGRAIAARCAAEGARVVVTGRDERTARHVAAELPGAIGVACDMSETDSLRALCARVTGELGVVDLLVNNAGVASRRAITRMTDEEWFESLAVNLTGPAFLIRAVVPGMKELGWGRIVNVTSNAATHGTAGFAAYAAAKGGIIGITRTLAMELAGFGIHVNALSPAALTDMLKQLPPEILEPMVEAGLPTVDDCAAAALALLVDAAPNGEVVDVVAS